MASLSQLFSQGSRLANRRYSTNDAEAVSRVSQDLLRRIPLEIYVLIFEFCAASDAQALYNFFFDDTTKAPWSLSHVCSQWRAIALNTPTLWSVVRISMDALETSSQSMDSAAKMLTTYLERSNISPLSIFVISEENIQQSIIQPLIYSCTRWRDVLLFINPTFLSRLAPIRGRLPQLRSLNIITTEFDEAGNTHKIFEEAPNLEQLTLRGAALDLGLALPWSQINVFEANYVEPADVLNIVPTMPRIRSLRLGREPPEHAPVDTDDWEIQHENVESMQLDIVDGHAQGHPGDLLDHLILPAMVDLSITCDVEESIGSVRELLRRSACTICSLTLDIRLEHSARLIEMFRDVSQFVRLSRLTLVDGDLVADTPFLDALAVRQCEPEAAILPELQNITVTMRVDGPGRTVQRWLDTLESRVNPVQPADPETPRIKSIQRIEFRCITGDTVLDNPVIVDRFRRLVLLAGVKVEFHYGPGAVD